MPEYQATVPGSNPWSLDAHVEDTDVAPDMPHEVKLYLTPAYSGRIGTDLTRPAALALAGHLIRAAITDTPDMSLRLEPPYETSLADIADALIESNHICSVPCAACGTISGGDQ